MSQSKFQVQPNRLGRREDGDAWNYFSHDQARLGAYRWGEDGLAGISDDHQRATGTVVSEPKTAVEESGVL